MKELLIFCIVIIFLGIVGYNSLSKEEFSELIRPTAPNQSSIFQNVLPDSLSSIPTKLEENDDQLKNFLQNIAYLLKNIDLNNINITYENSKLDIASLYITPTSDGNYNVEEMHTALEELFGDYISSPIKDQSLLGIKYNNKEKSYQKEESSSNVILPYLIKIEKQSYENYIHSITFIYCVPSKEDLNKNNLDEYDCYRSTIDLKINNMYKFSKYRLMSRDILVSNFAGKYKDLNLQQDISNQ